MIYGVILEIKGSLALGDTRWTYFQDPWLVEDALGFKFPVPSEYDYELLDTIIKHRFSDGLGSLDVKAGNYELFKAKDSKQVISSGVLLIPGSRITMAILLERPEPAADYICPMPRCTSSYSAPVPGGGRYRRECKIWFGNSTKSRRPIHDLLDVIDQQASGSKLGKRKFDDDNATSHKRPKVSQAAEYNLESFKNLKFSAEITTSQMSKAGSEIESSLNADSESVIGEKAESEVGSEGESEVESGLQLAVDEKNRNPAYSDAIEFVKRVKKRSEDNPEIHKQFLEILQTYQRENRPIQDVYLQMKNLFRTHGDLLKTSSVFCPGVLPSMVVSSRYQAKHVINTTAWQLRDLDLFV